jgi:rSAM/selenodomain-associated transferase 2
VEKAEGAMKPCDISVIIPVFHEQAKINETLEPLFAGRFDGIWEIIVVDGDPEGTTLKAICDDRVLKAASEKGRGKQMNQGALLASGEIVLFLHADTEIPPDGLARICSVMRQSNYVGGSFDLGIRSHKLRFRLVERVASLRSRITRIPYGDQAIFLRREYFLRIGGFLEVPLMEDVELMRRIKHSGGKICILGQRVVTSARRWEAEGLLYCTLRNWMLMLFYLCGVSPERLARFYNDRRGTGKDEKQVRTKQRLR